MDASFYTAARGAMTEQEKINVISNNMANVNTVGYRAKRSVFSDLLYYNMHSYDRNSTGTGVKLQHTNTSFEPGGLTMALEGGHNFAIEKEGFFMLQDQIDGSISYTRAGNFSLSVHDENEIYLISDTRKFVLDKDGEPIKMVYLWETKEYLEEGEDNEEYEQLAEEVESDEDEGNLHMEYRTLSADPAVCTFINTNDMRAIGKSEYQPVAKNGEPILLNTKPIEGYLELSNADVAQDLSDMIIAQRAYSYALKMVTTSDEVEQTINGLRT